MATLQEQIAEIQASGMPQSAIDLQIFALTRNAEREQEKLRNEQIRQQADAMREAIRLNADAQRDTEKARLDELEASGQITSEERLAGYQAADDARDAAFSQATAERNQMVQSTLPADFVPDTRSVEQIRADLAQKQAELQGQAAQNVQSAFERFENLPPIPVAQAPSGQPAQLSTLTPTTGPQATGPQGQSFLTGTQPTGTNMVTPLNPDTLPALRGAAAGSSSIDPTLRPYLELGLRGAEQLFLQQQPSLFPGQMFVSPSEQTQAALNMQEDIALAQPTTLQAAQESFMRGLGGIGATAGGAFLMGSPFRQQMIESATRPLMQQFEETTLPGVSSLYSRAGRYGSGAMDRAVGQATEATGRAIGDVASNIAFQDYSAERQRQQQALGLQLQGATMAPQIYGQQFLPSQQLAQVGAAREAIAAQPLQEDIQRFQFQQQIPYQQLQGFLSSIYGTPLAGSQYAPPASPAQTNRAASALGGAALGAGIGQMIGGGLGGFSSTAIGAGLGGLGGLLF